MFEMDCRIANEIIKDTAGPVYERYGVIKSLCEQVVMTKIPERSLIILPWIIVAHMIIRIDLHIG